MVASPDNKLCEKSTIDIEDLMDTSFIVHSTTSQLYTNFKKFTEEAGISENISMYLGSIDAIKYAIYADLGISIMPYYAVKFEIEMGLLKELNIKSKDFSYPYSLIYNKNKYLSAATLKFIEILKQVCQTT
jgi:DNA-binding transcriptional LysR family regulator